MNFYFVLRLLKFFPSLLKATQEPGEELERSLDPRVRGQYQRKPLRLQFLYERT